MYFLQKEIVCNIIVHYAILHKHMVDSYLDECCLGHLIQDHIHLSAIFLFVSHSDHWQFRFVQTKSRLDSLSFG